VPISRSTIYLMISRGRFPKQISLGARDVFVTLSFSDTSPELLIQYEDFEVWGSEVWNATKGRLAESLGGEPCMGCRWEAPTNVDRNLFVSFEVINGGRIMFSSVKYWEAQLRDGHRLAGVGGSDSHNATSSPGPPGSIGWPTTVVEAEELSVPAILNGIRAGRTFVDLTASHDKVVDFEAESRRNSRRRRHAAVDEQPSLSELSLLGLTPRSRVRLTLYPDNI
jgi:hypothetical protein